MIKRAHLACNTQPRARCCVGLAAIVVHRLLVAQPKNQPLNGCIAPCLLNDPLEAHPVGMRPKAHAIFHLAERVFLSCFRCGILDSAPPLDAIHLCFTNLQVQLG